MTLHRSTMAMFCFLWGSMSSAHELWIEPEAWQIAENERLIANVRNGEEFAGSALIWSDRNVTRAELSLDGGLTPYTGRLGDRPALVTTPAGTGLGVVLYETTPASITYRTWEKFAKFVDHKALGITKDGHLAAGHPEADFRESYTRHAKSLVRIGEGTGADQAYGLETEIVAETNPYDAAFAGTMAVRLLYDGSPRPQSQIEIFDRAPDGKVSISLVTTDAEGRAAFDVSPGHTYLLDAVLLRPSAREGFVYDSLWAGLSFFVP